MVRTKMCARTRTTVDCIVPCNQVAPYTQVVPYNQLVLKAARESAPKTYALKNTYRRVGRVTVALRDFFRIRMRRKRFQMRLKNIRRVMKQYDMKMTLPFRAVTKFCGMAVYRGSLHAKVLAHGNW